MAIETTLPRESTPEPDALPTTADDHIALTGNASMLSMATGGVTLRSDTPLPLRTQIDQAILSNWDQPQPQQPPRPSTHIINEPPASPAFPSPVHANVAATAGTGVVGVTDGSTPGQATGESIAGQVGTFVLNAERGSYHLNVRQSSFQTLEARIAVLEAALASRPARVGHNRGPSLDENLGVDEAGIQHLIALLKVQRATAPVDLGRSLRCRVEQPTDLTHDSRKSPFSLLDTQFAAVELRIESQIG